MFSKTLEIDKINYVTIQKTDEEISKSITGNNLYLSAIQIEIALPSIKKQLEIYMIEPRFDLINKSVKFDVRIKGANKIKKISEPDTLYLVIKQDDIFDFSEEKTPVFMQILKIDASTVQVTLTAELKEANIEGQNICESFNLPITDFSFDAKLEDKYEFKVLTAGKWWGEDLFLNIRNKENSSKERLEIDGDILFVEERDVLIFKDGKWTVAALSDNTLDYPLARIKSINSKSLEIEAWNISGDSKYLFTISSNSLPPFFNKTDQLITMVRRRTNRHISCMFDKQRIVIKEQDVLIKKDNRWKLLKREAVLNDIKNEELFYFEKIEVRGSKKILVGYFFNAMRTNYQKIEIPVVSFVTQKRLKKR